MSQSNSEAATASGVLDRVIGPGERAILERHCRLGLRDGDVLVIGRCRRCRGGRATGTPNQPVDADSDCDDEQCTSEEKQDLAAGEVAHHDSGRGEADNQEV